MAGENTAIDTAIVERRWWPLLIPVVFAVGAWLGIVTIGVVEVVGPEVVRTVAVVVPLLLVALVLPQCGFWGPRWTRPVSLVAVVGGLPATGVLMLSPMAYDGGYGKADWIDPLGMLTAAALHLGALIVVFLGTITTISARARTSSGPDRWRMFHWATVAGTFFGAAVWIALHLLISWDLS